MRHSIRAQVRVLVTALSIASIVIGSSEGGNPLVHPVDRAGSILIFVGIVVLCGYWSLVCCSWYSTLTVRQLASSNAPTTHPIDAAGPLGHRGGRHGAEDVAVRRAVTVQAD
jgi:hypothetical protein